jgi:phenylacetate-CoA ligase
VLREDSGIGLSVIAPCLNEAASLPELVRRTFTALAMVPCRSELILVNDGSADDTADVVADLQETFATLRIVSHASNRGIHAAWLSGLDAARYSHACLIDSDLQNPPEAIPQLWMEMERTHADVVQGTRSSIEWNNDWRYKASRVLNFLLNLCFADRAVDNKSGFVIAPTRVLKHSLDFPATFRYPNTFIRVGLRSKGYSVAETETLFLPRVAGESFLTGWKSIAAVLGVLRDLPRALVCFGRGQKEVPLVRLGQGELPPPRIRYSRWRRFLRWTYFITMPLHAWHIRPRTRHVYEYLQRTQWMDQPQLRALQREKLKNLIQYSYAHVPYYRDVMVAMGLLPSDILSLDDIQKMPLLSKDDVRENLYFALFSRRHNKRHMHKIATSGSTGQPFVVYADRPQLEFRFATTLRCLEWSGWRFGDRQVRLWHQTLGMSWVQVFKERLDALLLRRTFVPAFELDEPNLQRMVRLLERKKPVLIDGYAESLNFLAAFLQSREIEGLRPKAIMSSAQVLTDQTREAISGAFRCLVLDKYGAREFSGIAYECGESATHHVMDESYLVEVLIDDRPALPGEVGEVVITDLNNYSVPLIRYRIGDLAVAVDAGTPCKCGRSLSQIGRIQGRTQALVHCGDGTWLPGTFFAHFFKDYEHIVSIFQVVQSDPGAFTVRLVPGSQWSAEGEASMIGALSRYASDTSIEVLHVESIPLLRTGKRSPVVSSVSVDFQSMGGR